jgi:hypothetical protein
MMKNTSKRTTTTTPILDRKPSAGPDGFATTPPAYGIESFDLAAPAQSAPLQMKADLSAGSRETKPALPNCTGLPDGLKSGIEALSGLALDDVRVHYNSPKPAQLQARAYTQGPDIHVAPGQERHLPHEAWHVVQQKQGRVGSTFQMKGVPVNDDVHLESEADAMGTKAAQLKARAGAYSGSGTQKSVPGDSPFK